MQEGKYKLTDVRAMVFDDRKDASDFIAANVEIIREFSVQSATMPVIVLIVWKR